MVRPPSGRMMAGVGEEESGEVLESDGVEVATATEDKDCLAGGGRTEEDIAEMVGTAGRGESEQRVELKKMEEIEEEKKEEDEEKRKDMNEREGRKKIDDKKEGDTKEEKGKREVGEGGERPELRVVVRKDGRASARVIYFLQLLLPTPIIISLQQGSEQKNDITFDMNLYKSRFIGQGERKFKYFFST